MHIKIKCPCCSKEFTVDVPAIDRYKAECELLKEQMKSGNIKIDESDKVVDDVVDRLKDIFGFNE